MTTPARAAIALIAVAALLTGCSKKQKSSTEIDLAPGDAAHAVPTAPLAGGADETSRGEAADPGAASISTTKKPARAKKTAVAANPDKSATRQSARHSATHKNTGNASVQKHATVDAKKHGKSAAKKHANTLRPRPGHDDYAVNPK